MLVGPGGRQRTEEEYRNLLGAADLELTSVIPTATEMSILEVRPKQSWTGRLTPASR